MNKSLALHNELTRLVKTERKIMHEVLACIQKIDTLQSYRELGYASLFDYLTKAQGYTEGPANERISAARLLREIPELEEQIKSGKINLTQVGILKTALNQEVAKTRVKVSLEKKKDLLAKIENKTKAETIQFLTQELNYEPVRVKESLTPIKDEFILTAKLNKSQEEKLKLVQSLLSHVSHQNTYSDLLETLFDLAIKQKMGKESKLPTPQEKKKPAAAAAVKYRKTIPVTARRLLLHRAGNQCEYESPLTQQRCSCRYQLQVDHRIPLGRGGKDELENLRVLCRAHNLLEAKNWGF